MGRRGQGAVGKGEQIGRTCVQQTVALAIVERCAYREPVAVERDGLAEEIARLQHRDQVQAVRAAITTPDHPCGRGGIEKSIGEGEQVNRAGFRGGIIEPIVSDRTDGKTRPAERNAGAEPVSGLEIHVQVIATRIARPEGCSECRRGEAAIGEGEQKDRSGLAATTAVASVAWRADRQTIAIKRDAGAERLEPANLCDREILAARITRTDDALQHGRSKVSVAEGEQIDRASRPKGVAKAAVTRRTYGKAIAIQRNRAAEEVECLQLRHSRAQTARITRADVAAQQRIIETGIGEGEQIDCAGIERGSAVAEAIVAGRADDKAIAIERYGPAKRVKGIEFDIEIEVRAEIGGRFAQNLGDGTTVEGQIGKGQQIDRT